MNNYIPQPMPPKHIQSPRYDAKVDATSGVVTIYRNDKDGKLSLEEVEKLGGKS